MTLALAEPQYLKVPPVKVELAKPGKHTAKAGPNPKQGGQKPQELLQPRDRPAAGEAEQPQELLEANIAYQLQNNPQYRAFMEHQQQM